MTATEVAAIVATADWVNPLIAALAALGGALVGAGAVIWITLHGERVKGEQERRAALVEFYAAANALALMWNAWAEMQIKGPLADVRLGIRMFGFTSTILARLWQVTDAFWRASGIARAVGTGEELKAVDGIESVIANGKFSEPLPEAWGPAIRRVRLLIERRSGAVPEVANHNEHDE